MLPSSFAHGRRRQVRSEDPERTNADDQPDDDPSERVLGQPAVDVDVVVRVGFVHAIIVSESTEPPARTMRHV